MRLGPEDFLPYDPGPFRPGEEKEIADSVDEFIRSPPKPYRGKKESRDYRASDAPAGLVRRFLLQRPNGVDGDWIPWREFPMELYGRVWAANSCKQAIYRAHLLKSNYEVATVSLTLADVLEAYESERRYRSFSFDLSDVYVCLEADILKDYENRDHPEGNRLRASSNPTMTEERVRMTRRICQASADWSRDILALVGQGLSR